MAVFQKKNVRLKYTARYHFTCSLVNFSFYRTMLCRVRLCHTMSSVRLSVRL